MCLDSVRRYERPTRSFVGRDPYSRSRATLSHYCYGQWSAWVIWAHRQLSHFQQVPLARTSLGNVCRCEEYCKRQMGFRPSN
jgi:hypothetical protein